MLNNCCKQTLAPNRDQVPLSGKFLKKKYIHRRHCSPLQDIETRYCIIGHMYTAACKQKRWKCISCIRVPLVFGTVRCAMITNSDVSIGCINILSLRYVKVIISLILHYWQYSLTQGSAFECMFMFWQIRGRKVAAFLRVRWTVVVLFYFSLWFLASRDECPGS